MSNTTTTYVQIDWAKASFYQYAKEAQDGFEENKSKTGNVTYRKYFNKGIEGNLISVETRDSNFGQQCQVTLKNDTEYYKIQFPVYDQKGFVEEDFLLPLIARLRNMEKGSVYTLYPYHLTADNQEKFDRENNKEVKEKYYDRRGLSIKFVGDAVPMFLTYAKGSENSIPQLTWKDNPAKAGSKKPSAASQEERSDFLLAELMSAVNGHLKYDSASSSTQTSSSFPTTDAFTDDIKTTSSSAEKVSKNSKPASNTNDLPF